MNLKKQIGAVVLAVVLAPAYVMAQDMEFNGTIVSKEEKSIKILSSSTACDSRHHVMVLSYIFWH